MVIIYGYIYILYKKKVLHNYIEIKVNYKIKKKKCLIIIVYY